MTDPEFDVEQCFPLRPHGLGSCPMPFRNAEYRRLVGQRQHCDACGSTATPIIIVQSTWHDTSCFSLCNPCYANYNRLSQQERGSWQLELKSKAMHRVICEIFEGRTAFRKEQ